MLEFQNSRSRMDDNISKEDISVEIVELPSNEDIVAQSMVETTTILADEGDKNKCPRCSGKVFEAEKMASNKGVFHRKCFNCQDCHRALDASSVNDGPEDGCIFCNLCYQKRFVMSFLVSELISDESNTSSCQFYHFLIVIIIFKVL